MGDFADLARRLQAVERDLKLTPSELREIGLVAARQADDAVRSTRSSKGSLADLSMSHWRRGDPVEIVSGARVTSDHEVTVAPVGKAKGPMRVLEDGRQSYSAGDRRNSGVYRSRKTGEVRQKTRKVKQNVSGHGGKGTWTRATEAMTRTVPALIERHTVSTLAKHLHRG